MQIFIQVPTWLGDAVMSTPSIENIIKKYPKAEIIIFGSKIATCIFSKHPNVKDIIIDTTKSNGNRLINTIKLAKSLNKFDYAISFRSTIFSKILLFFIKAKYKKTYQRVCKSSHQVIRYNDFINQVFKSNFNPDKLKIYNNKFNKKNVLGINPGATYGSAKRYYPEKFAQVINAVADKFDEVIIFGGPNEKDIADDIASDLTIDNYQNLATKLTLSELIDNIAQLKILITADSGPMHLAASFDVPTIALFGPTIDTETSPWGKNHTILKQQTEELDCMPCMQRECRLKHHKCMKNISPQQIIDVINQ